MGTISRDRDAERRRSKLSQPKLLELLSPTATTAERVNGLLGLGLHPADIGTAVGGATPSTLRNWIAGATEPRADAAISLDDLRATARALLEGGLEPQRVVSWLISRDGRFEGQRPIDILARRPTLVLSVAFERVLDEPGAEL
jgi:hypothetical protein